MIDLSKHSLADTMPSSIKDNCVDNAVKSIDVQLQEIYLQSAYTLLLPRIDFLSEELIDKLAWQYHVDIAYQDLPIEKKRELVKTSISAHRLKGTPAAVENIIATIFKSAKIEEWYEYGGEAYYFRILDILEGISGKEVIQQLLDAVNTVKNTRSWLENINFLRNLENEIGLAMVLTINAETGIYPATPIMKDLETDVCAGGVILQHRKVVVR